MLLRVPLTKIIRRICPEQVWLKSNRMVGSPLGISDLVSDLIMLDHNPISWKPEFAYFAWCDHYMITHAPCYGLSCYFMAILFAECHSKYIHVQTWSAMHPSMVKALQSDNIRPDGTSLILPWSTRVSSMVYPVISLPQCYIQVQTWSPMHPTLVYSL